MVDMPAFHHHEMEGRDLVGDAIHDSANPGKRKKPGSTSVGTGE